jgi:hypothetical protein
MIFANYPGHFVAIALLVTAAVLLFLSFRSPELQKEKYKFLRIILIGIRYFIIVIIILILWNPSRSKIVNTFSKNNVLVLFDTSQSMSMVEKSKTTRLDKTIQIFDDKFLSHKAESPGFKILGFDNDVYHSGSTQLLRRWGNHTNIHNILGVLNRYDAPANISQTKGAIIFTDGQADDQRTAAYQPLMRADFPVLIVGVGSRENDTDIEIKTIKAPVKALIDSIYSVEVIASADNLMDESVTIELLRDNIVIDSNSISKETFAKNKDVPVKFTVGANTLGNHNISARAGTTKNETNLANNIQSTFVEVVDNKKLNVLYYTQVAEFNAGKLREALTFDPRINLDFCLDAIKSASHAKQVVQQLNYTKLPETQDEFNKYDIIILGNISFDSLSDRQINNLYNFVVQKGGGLLLLPGREDYGPAGWKNPKAVVLLPVLFDTDEPKLWPPQPDEIEMKPQAESRIVLSYDEIPEYDFKVSSFYNIEKVKPASATLAVSADRPLIILHRVGRGRVCLVNISKLFSWYREDKKGGWLYSLMSAMTSYLSQTPGSSGNIELFAERKNMEENTVKFTAYVRDNIFSPVEQANVLLNFHEQVYVMEPSGSGYYVTEIDNIQTDRIVATVQAETGGVFLGEKPIAVSLPACKNEMSDTKFNEPFLQDLTKQLNCTYLYSDDVTDETIKMFDAQTQTGHTRQIESMWPIWLLWTVLCSLLSIEWFIRRAKGLV